MERTHIHSHWKILKSCHPPSTKKLKFTLAAGIQIHYRGTIGGLSINQTNNYFDQRKLPQMSFLVIADFCFDEFWPVPRNDRYYLDFRSVEFFSLRLVIWPSEVLLLKTHQGFCKRRIRRK
jgi:hypothetical protein